MEIGIIGAGAMGQAICKHFIRAGHKVMISNSRKINHLKDVSKALKSESGTPEEAAKFGDVVIIAVPLYAYKSLPTIALSGKIVIDLLNYFPNRDGPILELLNERMTTSELLASELKQSYIVKAFNSITVDDLIHDARPNSKTEKRAIPIAGNDTHAKIVVSELIENIGFDVVDVGLLSDSWKFERFRPIYCCSLHKDHMEYILDETQRDIKVPDGYWIHNRKALLDQKAINSDK